MAIEFVTSGGTANTVGTADTSLRVYIPGGVQRGDFLAASYTNVGNYRSVNNVSPTLNSGWHILQEVTDITNTYFVVLGKFLTAEDVANAGSVQVVGTFPNTSGNTVYASRSVVYTGVDNSVLTPPSGGTALNHNPSPSGSTTSVSIPNEVGGTWRTVGFFSAAKSTGTSGPGSWSFPSGVSRGSSGAGTTLTATVGIVDFDNESQSASGTISYTPSRTNASMVTLVSAPEAGLVTQEVQYPMDVSSSGIYEFTTPDLVSSKLLSLGWIWEPATAGDENIRIQYLFTENNQSRGRARFIVDGAGTFYLNGVVREVS